MPACSCCNKKVDEHRSVSCLVCQKAYNIECVDVSPTEARKIRNKTGLTWTCKKCSLIGNDLASLKGVLVSLQEEILLLKQRFSDKPSEPSSSLMDMEKVIQEIADRDRRKCNVIVYGIREPGRMMT